MQKRAINKTQFNLLVLAAKGNKSLQAKTRGKLIAAYTLLYYTACRIDEIRLFKKEDINTLSGKGELLLPKEITKTKKARVIRVAKEGEIELGRLRLKGGYVFTSGKRDAEPLSKTGFNRLLNSHIRSVLGEFYSSHSFRAGAATRLCEQGLIKAAQMHLGHASAATTLIYQRLSEQELKEALDRAC